MTGDLMRLAKGTNVAAEVRPSPAGDVRRAGGGGARGVPVGAGPGRHARRPAQAQEPPARSRPSQNKRVIQLPALGAVRGLARGWRWRWRRSRGRCIRTRRSAVSRYQAVLFDAFGTLIELDRPAARLQAAAAHAPRERDRARAGGGRRCAPSSPTMRPTAARRATSPPCFSLQRECAAIVLDRAGARRRRGHRAGVLSDAIVFRAFPDAPPALRMVGELGLARPSCRTATARCRARCGRPGIEVGVVVDSATGGAAKPDPAIFALALRRLGVDAAARAPRRRRAGAGRRGRARGRHRRRDRRPQRCAGGRHDRRRCSSWSRCWHERRPAHLPRGGWSRRRR